MIDVGRYLSVKVDLYYWKENACQYHTAHNYYYSLLIGYDEEEKVLYFDDADIDIGFLKLSYEVFMEAIVIEDSICFALETIIPDNFILFHYEFDNVVLNAI